jgi:hypothetical protein
LKGFFIALLKPLYIQSNVQGLFSLECTMIVKGYIL